MSQGSFEPIATGLRFPEGPVALPDGGALVTEVARGTLTRVAPDGSHEAVAECGGGPAGAAAGPDGRIYVCNSGEFEFDDSIGLVHAVACGEQIDGRIQRVDVDTGEVEELYAECDGRRLETPNDLVFDAEGGFYFTDFGHWRGRRQRSGAIFYARADGSAIECVVESFPQPNGIGLSPDGSRLYVASSMTARLWWWEVSGPGALRGGRTFYAPGEGNFLWVGSGAVYLDSLGVDGDGNVCVAQILDSGIAVVGPDGGLVEFISIPEDPFITNICFGGEDLGTAFVTGSSSGTLFRGDWKRPGLRLNYELGAAA